MVDRNTAPAYTNHEHCQQCYFVKCSSRVYPPQNDCPVITCAQNCGFRFHACKLDEHRLTCPNEKVNCINYSNGCPILLQRCQLGRHLETCPASVVYCTMEWNRWPVYSEERKARVPFKQNNIHARYGQLDVALALRDQTVLNESRKVPRKTRQALRNNLTARFPAVPIQVKHEQDSHDSCDTESTLTISDEEGDAPWDVSRNPPGLQSSVCNKLFKATKCATESLAAALSVVTESDLASKRLGDKSEQEKLNCDEEHNFQSEDKRGETPTASSQNMQVDSHEFEGLNNDVDCNDSFDTMSESDDLVNGQALGNISDISNDNIVNGEDYCQWTSEASCNIFSSCKNEVYQPKDLNTCVGTREVTQDCSIYVAPGLPPVPLPPPPPAPPTPFSLNQILALDLNLESITRYQAKPLSMYTFLCAQQFRRDEYGWHFKNVHGDIHGGLSGWLEQRCPMATYGCTYSVRRLHPNECGSQIVYSPIVHSFGIKPAISKELSCLTTPEKKLVNISQTVKNQLHKQKEFGDDHIRKESTPEIYTSKDYKAEIMVNGNRGLSPSKASDGTLTSLPVEVLRHITSFLDNFSINHLALTCNLLRDVCCSLLEDRGMVIEEWERKKVGHQFKWTIAYKRWCFSSAFTPVEKWGFEENTHMSEHLKTCMFRGQVEHRLEPYPVPGMECTHMHSANFWEVMQRMGLPAQMETGPCICPQVETVNMVKEKDDGFTATFVKHII